MTKNERIITATKINASNDRNGNPRRGWLLHLLVGDGTHDAGYASGDFSGFGRFLGFVDEGYGGRRPLWEAVRAIRDAARSACAGCTAGEYREALRAGIDAKAVEL